MTRTRPGRRQGPEAGAAGAPSGRGRRAAAERSRQEGLAAAKAAEQAKKRREEEAERAQGSSASASAGAGASTQPSPRRPATKRAIPPGAEVIDVTSGRESMRRGAARRGHTGVLERWLKREPED